MDVESREFVVVSPPGKIVRRENVLPDIDIVRKQPLPYQSSIGLASIFFWCHSDMKINSGQPSLRRRVMEEIISRFMCMFQPR
jgi:hypothetical protein